MSLSADDEKRLSTIQKISIHDDQPSPSLVFPPVLFWFGHRILARAKMLVAVSTDHGLSTDPFIRSVGSHSTSGHFSRRFIVDQPNESRQSVESIERTMTTTSKGKTTVKKSETKPSLRPSKSSILVNSVGQHAVILSRLSSISSFDVRVSIPDVVQILSPVLFSILSFSSLRPFSSLSPSALSKEWNSWVIHEWIICFECLKSILVHQMSDLDAALWALQHS